MVRSAIRPPGRRFRPPRSPKPVSRISSGSFRNADAARARATRAGWAPGRGRPGGDSGGNSRRRVRGGGRGRGPRRSGAGNAGPEIGEVERAGSPRAAPRTPRGRRRRHSNARPGSRSTPSSREHAVELAARAAIAIGAEDRRAERAQRGDLAPHRLRDELRPVVQLGRQAGELDAGQRGSVDDGRTSRASAAGDDDQPGGALSQFADSVPRPGEPLA